MSIYDLIANACRDKDGNNYKDYSVHLTGDLCQMSAQHDFLRNHGISVRLSNVYPCIRPCDEKRVFELIWLYKCEGWWHYMDQYVRLGICTEQQFKDYLHRNY